MKEPTEKLERFIPKEILALYGVGSITFTSLKRFVRSKHFSGTMKG